MHDKQANCSQLFMFIPMVILIATRTSQKKWREEIHEKRRQITAQAIKLHIVAIYTFIIIHGMINKVLLNASKNLMNLIKSDITLQSNESNR